MKLPCNVIEDLLPLYHDEVCSQESKVLVEEHIKECEKCKSVLSKLNDSTNTTNFNTSIDDTKPFKAISSAWIKDKKKAFLKGTIIAVAACALLFAGYKVLTTWKCIPVSADLLEVSQVSQLSDGRIIYHLNVKDNKNIHFTNFTTNKDGSTYITPMRSIIEGKQTTESGLFKDYFMVDIAEDNAYQQHHGDGIEITSCYLGPQDNGILIWKEGMKLPKASDVLEHMAK